jgi:Fe-S cluster biosynthesis and repair protein YggX
MGFMNEQAQRIAQFQKMANDDPSNELGHFSLGKAYLEAGRPGEAVPSLRRVIELRRSMSKAYQLLGEAYEKLGRCDEAVEITKHGVAVADEIGDVMPRDAMIRLLESWGEAPPVLKKSTAAPVYSQTDSTVVVPGFRCSRCGRPDTQLPKPPFKGQLGQRVFQNVCALCWREWIPTGTKVINELGLQLSSPAGQQAYDQYMQEFLQLEPPSH